MKRIAIIPAYEPNETFLDIIKSLKGNNYEIVVVNDGSDERYDKIFEEISSYAKVLTNEKNMGKGYALKTAFRYVYNTYPDSVIVTLDCDGQHAIHDVIKITNLAIYDPSVLHLGSRIIPKNAPFTSRRGNQITRNIFKFVTKKHIYDTQTGLRAFTSDLLPYLIETRGERFEYEMCVLLNFTNMNIPIKEVSIEAIYYEGNVSTHFRSFADAYLIYKEIFRHLFTKNKAKKVN